MSNSQHIGKIKLHHETNPSYEDRDGQTTEQLRPRLSRLDFISHRLFAPSIYIVFGILVFLISLLMFNTYVLHLKVETAVISSEIETMIAPVNGYIHKIYVSAGEHVIKGTPLLTIESIELGRALELARIRLAESKLDIGYYKHLLSNEEQRLKFYQKIGASRLVSAKTQVNKSLQTLVTAQRTLERFTQLNKKQYVSEASLESKRSQYVNAQETLADARAQQSIERHALHAISQGMYFTGSKTEGILHDLEAELIAAQKKALLNKRRVAVYETLIQKLTLIAPFDGTVTRVLKSEGNTTDHITPIIFIEKDSSDKQITAYLTQDEIVHIGLDGAKIYIPALGKTYAGKIIDINRTDGFIDEVQAQYRWRDFQIDRSAKVTLKMQQKTQDAFEKTALSGMPVVVYFSKKHLLI